MRENRSVVARNLWWSDYKGSAGGNLGRGRGRGGGGAVTEMFCVLTVVVT